VTILTSFTAESPTAFYILSGLNIGLHIMWLGPCAASIQDLVLPRMRGTATAVFFLGTTIIGLGLGPYVVGLVSDVTGSLQGSLLGTVTVVPLILICGVIAYRTLPGLENNLLDRARDAGEKLPD
jgi:MFS family permease